MIVAFALTMAAERWLQHEGRLCLHTSRWMTFLSSLIVLFMAAGSSSLIFLTIFDVRDRPAVHYPLVTVFM